MAGNRNSGMCSPLCSDVCAFYLPQGLTHPPLLGEVPIANVGGHWNKKQGEQAHTRHKQHLHH